MRKLWLAPLIALASASAAHASDFTIVVPVSVHNLAPEIVSFEVYCTVLGSYPAGGVPPLVGSGHSVVPLRGGAFVGDVTVAFNADDPRFLSVAAVYECSLSFHQMVDGRDHLLMFIHDPSGGTTDLPPFPLAAGAPVVSHTRAPLP